MNAPSTPDRLSGLLRRFEIKAGVFHIGSMCGLADFATPESGGHFHILRTGCLGVTNADGDSFTLAEPTVLFYPQGLRHRFDTGGMDRQVELICASIDLGGEANPLVSAIPAAIGVPFTQCKGLKATIDVLIEEAFTLNCGREIVLDRLCEVVVVKLLRHVIRENQVKVGVLAGLAHPRLCRALTAIHDAPEKDWTLEWLADAAGMSRTTFANVFRDVVGVTPGNYLLRWRLSLAKGLLSQGNPLKGVAQAVGYASPAALSRAYTRQFGLSPRESKHRMAPRMTTSADART